MALIFNNSRLNALFGRKFNSISSIAIDVTINESHRRSNSLTQRAVEGGDTITDNVILMPDTVSMSCIIKNDLLGETWEEKLDKLEQIRRAREPFDIVTSLGAYPSMFFDGSIVINRNTTNRSVLAFNATFTSILIIESFSTAVPITASKEPKKTAPKTDVGKKQPVENTADANNKKASLIGRVFF